MESNIIFRNPYKLNLSKYSTHNIILKRLGKNLLILDVGCNDGYIGAMSDKSNIFYGLDSSSKVIKNAQKKYSKTLVYDLNHLKKLPWNVKFDIIIFADVLEHLLFPNKTLSFIVKNYLKKSGKVIISLPNIANWQVRASLLTGNFNYSNAGILDKTHLHFYTLKTAKELITSNNLKIIEVQSGSSIFGYLLNYLPFLRELFSTSFIFVAKFKYAK